MLDRHSVGRAIQRDIELSLKSEFGVEASEAMKMLNRPVCQVQ
jgi:hypothetical protein